LRSSKRSVAAAPDLRRLHFDAQAHQPPLMLWSKEKRRCNFRRYHPRRLELSTPFGGRTMYLAIRAALQSLVGWQYVDLWRSVGLAGEGFTSALYTRDPYSRFAAISSENPGETYKSKASEAGRMAPQIALTHAGASRGHLSHFCSSPVRMRSATIC
jgi:hypothetical protein